MKKFFGEFKEFIMRGNVMDLAVGVIIGGAFSAIVTSLTDDIISPILGLFGGLDLSDLVAKIGDVEIRYGAFITAIINFLIMALVIFLMVKAINKAMSIGKKKEEEPAPTTKKCPHCCEEVNINATKCPHCTGDIPAEEE
ncbi:MAG: large conductance mechanosensitive channel protein MscL [Ruminococcus sp.]|uniref:large conductance mechanosensitive channel protein MscL n=1 Tax=Ruminococcus sp. TaxID=41978 RepID=UPI002873EC7B|nr:large conductance mechanosensitive channel protein MscL [Ruminococcus sp.]MBQ3285654.1 large conductance mechanosensitive channel protein MscL [Ruminococcus sp.]